MRVSTFSTYLTGMTAMQRLQAALDHTQRQVSSGRRILVPSDDPVAAGRALELRESLSRLSQFDRNAGIAESGLAQEETALISVNDVLQRVRELALQANNATQSDASRQLIAIEMRDRLDDLVQIANQTDGNGRYLFSGNLSAVEPVSRTGSSFSYNGDQGQRHVQISARRQVPVGDPGSAVFFMIRAGNGEFTTRPAPGNSGTLVIGSSGVVDPTAWDQDSYTVRFIDSSNFEVVNSAGSVITTGAYQPGDRIAFQGIEISLSGEPAAGDELSISPAPYQNVFETIEKLATALELPANNDVARAAQTNGINAGLLDLDEAIGSVLNIRTRIGSRMSSIENQIDSNGAMALSVQEALAGIEDLDYAEALSRLSLEVTMLQAVQQSFVRTQQLTLFNFL